MFMLIVAGESVSGQRIYYYSEQGLLCVVLYVYRIDRSLLGLTKAKLDAGSQPFNK
jgi:hypothetical protein